MDKSPFDKEYDFIKKLIRKCRSTEPHENAVTVASKLMAISCAMDNIVREIDEFKGATVENVQRNVFKLTLMKRFHDSCDKLSAFDNDFRDFAENAAPRMAAIEDGLMGRIRAFTENHNDDAEVVQKVREITGATTELRDGVVAEIRNVDKGIELLTEQLNDTVARIKRQKIVNERIYEYVKLTQNYVLGRTDDLLTELIELLPRVEEVKRDFGVEK